MSTARPSRTRWGPAALLGSLGLLLPALVGPTCSQPSTPVTLTLNGVPEPLNDLLVVPPSGFTVDVGFPEPEEVVPGSLTIRIHPFGDSPSVDATEDLVVDEPGRAVAVVSTELEPGSYWVSAHVDRVGGGGGSASLAFAVREPAAGGTPLEDPQWVQLDFAADPDGDGAPDLPGDLQALGLLAEDRALEDPVTGWVTQAIVARAQSLYDAPNPSGLPGGDAPELVFSANAPASGAFTRICVGGADPSESGVIGNVLFDPGNGDPAQVACDTFVPSGVFPREMLAWSNAGAFQQAFGPVMATPVGAHPLDPVVLGPDYDPDDPDQLARFAEIEAAVEAFAQVVATVAAHETGHALGLVPRGAPGKGLFGGSSGALDTHNATPDGSTPDELLLMNAGGTFSFAELSGQTSSLPRIRALNFAYLRGRLVLDPRVTGIHPPPVLDYASPTEISISGPSVLDYTCKGENFLATPSVRLVGPLTLGLLSEALVSPQEVTATVPTLQLVTGTYDLELTNGDGQAVVLEDAVEVVP